MPCFLKFTFSELENIRWFQVSQFKVAFYKNRNHDYFILESGKQESQLGPRKKLCCPKQLKFFANTKEFRNWGKQIEAEAFVSSSRVKILWSAKSRIKHGGFLYGLTQCWWTFYRLSAKLQPKATYLSECQHYSESWIPSSCLQRATHTLAAFVLEENTLTHVTQVHRQGSRGST